MTYTRAMPDGGKEIYGLSNGGTGTTRYVYLTQIIDRFGNALTLCYNSGPNCGNVSPAQGPILLQSIIDANGLQTTFGYNNPNFPLQITSITDPYGRTATIGYDSAGRLTSITDIIGIVSSFAYDSPTGGHINQMTTPYGTTNFAYGGDEDEHAVRWIQITDPLGYSERVEYPQIYTVAVSHVVPLSEPQNTLPQGMIGLANSTEGTYYWDKHMYALVGENWAQARSTTWAYSNFAVMSTTMASRREPLENRVWYNYPGQTAANGGTGVPGTLLKPTRIGRVLDDGTTQLYSRQYNALGNLTFSADPVGRVTTLQYAPNQIDVTRVQQVTGSGPATIASYTYNGQHLPLTATDAAGQTTTYTYNAAGQVTSVTDPLGETTSYAYDTLGELLTVTNALGDTQASYSYDSYGRVATYTDSEGWTVGYAYDAFNRVTAEFYPDGTSRTYTYTNLDLTSVTDRQGRTTTYGYDANRELTSVTDPAGNVTQYSYYENGKLKTLTDADGHVTTWTIDLQSRVTAKTDANGVTTNYTYENTTSRMRAATDPLGQVKLYSYKPDDQLAGIQYNNAVNPTPPVFFSYDPFFPRRQTMTDGSGTTTYSYNPVGALGALKLAQETPPFANSAIAYSYDALGRVVSKSVGGDAETFAYDALGRLVTHTDDLGSFAQTYVGDTGQVTSRLANGIGTEWAYHGNFNDRRLKKIVNLPDNQKFGFVTTPENDITAITDDHKKETWSYSYDPADRLTAAASTQGPAYAYGYDPASNITGITTPAGMTSVTPTATNAVATAGGTAFRYDANGNLLADYARTYRWDAENRLIGIAGGGYSSSFTYDGLSRRIVITTTSGSATGSTHYGWCGETLCQQRTSSDVPTRRYLPEGEYDAVQGALIYGIDQLGSVREVIAGATGLKTNTFDYDPYGSVTKATGSRATWTDFRYAGLFYHQPSGLYLATYRAYDPAIGRWVSRDPIAERGGINLYGYVGGNPVGFWDSFGLDVTVTLYPGASGFGHVGVGVNTNSTNGYYAQPGSSLPDMITGTPGIEVPDTRTPSSSITIPTTPAQDQAMQNYINNLQKSGGTYTLLNNNCVKAVRSILNAGGITSPNTIFPRSFMNGLQDVYGPPPQPSNPMDLWGGGP